MAWWNQDNSTVFCVLLARKTLFSLANQVTRRIYSVLQITIVFAKLQVILLANLDWV